MALIIYQLVEYIYYFIEKSINAPRTFLMLGPGVHPPYKWVKWRLGGPKGAFILPLHQIRMTPTQTLI